MSAQLQTDIITATRLGHTFKASHRTVAWLDWLIADLARAFPRSRLVMFQSCYNTGVAASAGTHDRTPSSTSASSAPLGARRSRGDGCGSSG